jgi:hypothetical protein
MDAAPSSRRASPSASLAIADTGRLGRIQFMRGSHQQEMAGWPGYWEGLPPMHYATHAVSPCLALVKGEAEHVSCYGSGAIAERLAARYSVGEVR